MITGGGPVLGCRVTVNTIRTWTAQSIMASTAGRSDIKAADPNRGAEDVHGAVAGRGATLLPLDLHVVRVPVIVPELGRRPGPPGPDDEPLLPVTHGLALLLRGVQVDAIVLAALLNVEEVCKDQKWRMDSDLSIIWSLVAAKTPSHLRPRLMQRPVISRTMPPQTVTS